MIGNPVKGLIPGSVRRLSQIPDIFQVFGIAIPVEIRAVFQIPEHHLHNQRFIAVYIRQMAADQVILPVQLCKRLNLDKPEAVHIVCRPVVILFAGIRLLTKTQFHIIRVFEFKAKIVPHAVPEDHSVHVIFRDKPGLLS